MASIDKQLVQNLLEVGNKLLDPPSSVDNLLHLLCQVRRCLSRIAQSPIDSVHNELSPSLKVLIADKLIKHSDDDVKVALASCLIEITRITAPDAPYNDLQMKEVFRLIVSSFENLHDKSCRWYKERILILRIFANVKLVLEMLNLECDTLILEMFQNFFKTIREHHPKNVFSSMKTIMVLVLEESDDISLDLLSPILDCLNKENEVVLPIARKLGESVLQSCATRVKPYLRQAVNKLGISLDDYSDVLTSVCTVSLGVSESSSGTDSPKIKKRKLRKVGLTAATKVSAQQLPIISEETGDEELESSRQQALANQEALKEWLAALLIHVDLMDLRINPRRHLPAPKPVIADDIPETDELTTPVMLECSVPLVGQASASTSISSIIPSVDVVSASEFKGFKEEMRREVTSLKGTQVAIMNQLDTIQQLLMTLASKQT